MNDSVKFIFKTLVKVPIIICVFYLFFNLFAFTFTYFRLLGLSYVALQTAVENNYIPGDEQTTLVNYLNTLDTGIVSNLAIGCDTNTTNDAANAATAGTLNGAYMDITSPDNDNSRVQYGTPITVTVSAKYTWIFPLVNWEDDADHASYNVGLAGTPGTYGGTTEDNNIVISYTVPGLKYYPDMSS